MTDAENNNDEVAMFITADGAHGYYSFETKKNNQLFSELYIIDIPQEIKLRHRSSYISGIVYDSLTTKPLQANIELFNLSTNKAASKVVSDSINGKYLMVLTEGAEYALYIALCRLLLFIGSRAFALSFTICDVGPLLTAL